MSFNKQNMEEFKHTYVDFKIDENPQPNNLDGLKLIGIVREDGELNPLITEYGLYGEKMKYGIIDSGSVLPTHVEFANEPDRVTLEEPELPVDLHATHVAGTSAAIGVNPQSQGVAGKVNIHSFSFNSPFEKFENCGVNEINSVNNSYGTRQGWYFNRNLSRWEWYGYSYEYFVNNYADPLPPELQQDPYFGKYTSLAQNTDNSMETYKNMLLCFSAGNDRSDGSPDSDTNWFIRSSVSGWTEIDRNEYPLAPKPDEGFNTIGLFASAKNHLAVGASIDSSGESTVFSGWGTTNDLRIKPEVVANGLQVFSCSNASNTSYDTLSGTSMSCPFATGCSILIQEFCQKYLSYFPKSSTAKGSLIHGADFYEIPNDANVSGKHGYGIINMNNTLKFLDEVYKNTDGYALYNNEVMTNDDTEKIYTFDNGDAFKSLVVTLCWTDVPGVGNDTFSIQEPDDKSIINRLGLYIEHTNTQGQSTFYYPFRVGAYNENATMETSTEFDSSKIISYDNTQKIIIPETILDGIVKIVVLRDNTLTGNSQDFSLLVSNDTQPSCFVEGTKIMVDDDKFVDVKDLKVGDYVKTYKHGLKKIKFVYNKNHLNSRGLLQQIRKLDNGVYLTGGHSILLDNIPDGVPDKYKDLGKIDDKQLCLSVYAENSVMIENNDLYKVYHIVLENEDIYGRYGVYAGDNMENIVLCESLSYDWYSKYK